MWTLIWNCGEYLEEATRILFINFFLCEEGFDYRREFKGLFKCLSKGNTVS